MTGIEWIVEAYGCAPDRLTDLAALQSLFARIVSDVDLHPCQPPQWHQFPDSGGITGVCVLSESHLTCHTFPERGFAGFNLYCCRPRPDWPWSERLADALGATSVRVTMHPRGER